MSIKGSNPKPAAAAAAGQVPLTPEQIIEQLRVLREHIPDFGPLAVPDATALRRTAQVNDEMVQAATNTVGASSYLPGVVGKSAEDLRTDRSDVGRWSAVEHELWTMYKGVSSANLARRHRLGLTTLQTYFITRQLVRQQEHAHLLPHLAEMRRVNKFGRKRRPQPDAPATPAPPAPAPAKP